jgi:predicted amidohydrolase YtcJ
VTTYLFRGGAIRTMDSRNPIAEAVVVVGGRIAYVGPEAGASHLLSEGAEVIDLADGLLLPGFIDAHDHLATMGVGKLGVDLGKATDLDGILETIRAYVAGHPGQAVYRGFGWLPASFPNGSPRREWLDGITGDVPMIVNSADFHDLWFNTAAMKAAGVSASTPDPEANQYYVRDSDGTPTGHAVEAAPSLPIMVAVGSFTLECFREAQALTLDRAPSYGITTYFEAGVGAGATSADAEPVYADFIERDRSGRLDVRIAGTYWTRSESDGIGVVTAALVDWNARLRSEHVSIAHCKMWADGTLFSGGALLLQPACGPHGTVGRMTFSEDYIAAQVQAVQEAGFDMHIHVDADGSAHTVLNAIERVHREIGRGGSRHVIAHNSLVAPQDIPRYQELGVIANCTPLWGTDYRGLYAKVYTDLLGAERVEERVMPYGDLMRSGAVVTYGADLPGVDVDEVPPLVQIEAAVTRKRPGHPDDKPFVERQCVGLQDALRAYTINGAYQLRMEDRIGSIEVGKQADLVVLGRDLFDVKSEEIHSIPVVLTMMDGRVTYSAA